MERETTEDEKVMYKTMLKISKRVYETLQKEKEEKERL